MIDRQHTELSSPSLVDVRFVERAPHFVSLKLLQALGAMDEAPEALASYGFTTDHLAAIKSMALLNRGRLSVQPVTPEAYSAVELLCRNGGFEDIALLRRAKAPAKAKAASKKRKEASEVDDNDDEEEAPAPKKRKGRAPAKAKSEEDESSAEEAPPRRTTARTRK